MEGVSTTPTESTASVTVAALKKKKTPIWARMLGFPQWPARFCSTFEEVQLQQKKAPRPGQVAVIFLGRYVNMINR
jgi:hypothetical protein